MTQLHFVLMTATSGAPNKFVDVGSPVGTRFTAQTMCDLLAENLYTFSEYFLVGGLEYYGKSPFLMGKLTINYYIITIITTGWWFGTWLL